MLPVTYMGYRDDAQSDADVRYDSSVFVPLPCPTVGLRKKNVSTPTRLLFASWTLFGDALRVGTHSAARAAHCVHRVSRGSGARRSIERTRTRERGESDRGLAFLSGAIYLFLPTLRVGGFSVARAIR